MNSGLNFRAAFGLLDERMRAQAESDGDPYIPNPEPFGPVDYIFVCMEPSLGRWTRTPQEAKRNVEAGFRNFSSSRGDFILHFCIREYLCGPGERYHITDLSKGMMSVDDAQRGRIQRWQRWYPLLLDEIALVARPRTAAFAVGKKVYEFLSRNAFPLPLAPPLLHYSGQAGAARLAGVRGHEDAFQPFAGSLSVAAVAATASSVLKESMPATYWGEPLARLRRDLSDSELRLMFIYKRAFETLRETRDGRPPFPI